MSKRQLLSWREVVKTLTRARFQIERQKGSLLVLAKGERIVPVPKHEQIKKGILMAIIEEAGFTEEEFQQLLK